MPKGTRAPKAERVWKITYQEKNYKVPSHEIWKLTWKSPYMAGDIHPAYDVRVLGSCLTSKDLGTWVSVFSSKPGESSFMDINAGIAPAEIWIPGGTEFYLANDLIHINVESYNKAKIFKLNKVIHSDAVSHVLER
jgi:hypothetical protein